MIASMSGRPVFQVAAIRDRPAIGGPGPRVRMPRGGDPWCCSWYGGHCFGWNGEGWAPFGPRKKKRGYMQGEGATAQADPWGPRS